MKVLVCGGRNFSARDLLFEELDKIHEAVKITHLIHGAARGADRLASDWACSRGIEVSAYFAQWELYGKKAGPIRNQQMLDSGKPSLVVAFPGGNGTADMIKRAHKARIFVKEIYND